ncbi:MAG TPA: GNAT family N-acetyltransferase [Luteitalea sp.]|nr:GNAT family N-acetyltransferase [Luteitalea sp.]
MSEKLLSAAESDRLLESAWSYFARQLPDGHVMPSPGVLIANGRSPLPFMNAAILTDVVVDADDLRRRVGAAREQFEPLGLQWILMFPEDRTPSSVDVAGICGEAKLQYMMPMRGMVTDALAAPVRTLPALDLRVVEDAAGRQAVADLNAAGYGIPTEIVRPATEPASMWSQMVGVVGYVDGEPVSTASVAAVDDVAYVALVATSPAYQGRGYAEAVMRDALGQARNRWGVTRTILHATPAGAPVYTRMGYEDVGGYHVYVSGE